MALVTEPEFSSNQVCAAAGKQTAPSQLLRKYMPELDGLRAIAIISVVWHNVTAGHYSGNFFWRLVNLLSNAGWVGVQLFFVLSGFLITGILLDEKKSPGQLRNFYMRRALRIFPLYYAVLCFAFLLLPALSLAPPFLQDDLNHQFWYWTFLVNWSAPFLGDGQAFGHFWSLAVEEQFYLLWPLCVLVLSRRKLVMLGGFFVVSALLIRSALITYDLEFATAAAYKFTIVRWDALAVGALLALWIRDAAWSQLSMRYERLVLVAATVYIIIYAGLNHNFAPVGPSFAAFNQTAVALLFGAVLLASIRRSENSATQWQRFLSHPLMRSVGKYSYAIYVFHQPVRYLVAPLWNKFFPPDASPFLVTAQALAIFLVAYGAAVISWICLEQPCLRLKRFFTTAKA